MGKQGFALGAGATVAVPLHNLAESVVHVLIEAPFHQSKKYRP
jgi:hypothetical protein